MNRIYSLVWNRALRAVQVTSELATSAGGGNAAGGAATGPVRRHPLALACAAALALGAMALPAWSATSCIIAGVTYTDCIEAASGVSGSAPTGGVGGVPGVNNGGTGATAAANTHPNGSDGQGLGSNGGGGGKLDGGNATGGSGGTGGGDGGSIGATTGASGAGGGGGGLGSQGVGGGGGGGAAYAGAGAGNTVGGGGGGGGALGATVANGPTPTTIFSYQAVLGGNGGNGSNYQTLGGASSGSFGGGGGGGGAGVLLDNTLENDGLIAGGNGGNGGTSFSNPNGVATHGYLGGGGGGGAGVLIEGTNTLINKGIIQGGAGGGANFTQTVAGDGGAGVAGAEFTLANYGYILGGNGGQSGVTAGNGSGGVGVLSTLGAVITNYAGSRILGGLGGNGTTRADAIDVSGGPTTLANAGKIVGNVNLGATNVNSVELTAGGSIVGNLNIGNGTSSALTLDGVAGTQQLLSNAVTGNLTFAGALTKSGAGAWSINNAGLASTASATVSGGTLIVGAATGDGGAVGGPMTVDSGATLGGYGQVGTTTVNAGGTLAPGSSTNFGTTGTFGTFTINGALVLNSGSIVNVNLGAPGSNDKIQVNGNLTLGSASTSATLNVANVGSMGPGLYNVINYTGSLTSDGGLAIGTGTPTGQKLAVQTGQAGQINVLDSSLGPFVVWAPGTLPTLGGSGTWNLSSNDWTDVSNSPQQTWTQGGSAIFQGAVCSSTAPCTVKVDSSGGAIKAVGLQFFVDGYTLANNAATDALTLVADGSGNAPIINGGDGTAGSATYKATISAVLAGSDGFTKTDYGTLVLSGANTYSGNTTVNGGTLEIAAGGNAGNAAGSVTANGGAGMNSTLTVDSGASLSNPVFLDSTTTTLADCTSTGACATLTNAGTLNATSGFIIESDSGYAIVNNTGTIDGAGNPVELFTGGSVTNSGVLSAHGAYATGVWMGGAGVLDNKVGGSITGSSYGAYLSAGGSVTNAGGTIGGALGTSNLSKVGVGIGLGVGLVNNTVGGSISGSAYGVLLRGPGNVTNTASSIGANGQYGTAVQINGPSGIIANDYGGTLTGNYAGAVLTGGGYIKNDGAGSSIAALGTGAGNYVAAVINGGPGAVNNINGASITGTTTGITLLDGGTVNNDASSITGTDSYGAVVANGTGTNSVSNSDGGQITGGIAGVWLANGGSVSNDTTAGGAASTISGVHAGVALSAGGSITNGAGSIIEATGTTLGNGCNAATDDCAIAVLTAAGGGSGGATTLINAGGILGSVQLDPDAANSVTLTAGGSIAGYLDMGTNAASTLTLDGDNTTAQLYLQAVTGTTTFAGALAKSGTGTWIIDTNDLSTVTDTTISGGTLQIGNGGANGSVGNGDIANAGALVFDRNNALTFTGVISGAGSVQQIGTGGTTTLDGINTYTGPTTVTAGTLLVGDATHTTASIVTGAQVDAGATLGGFGTVGVAGTTTEIQSGGVLSPGAGTGSVGTLTFGDNLTLDATSVLDYDLGQPGSPNPFTAAGVGDSINVVGTLTFGGAATLNLAAAGGIGLYNLASYGTLTMTNCSFSGSTACLTFGTLPTGAQASDYTIVNNTQGSQIDLYNTAGQTLNIWAPNGTTNLGGTGTWSATSATWTDTNGNGPGPMLPFPGFAIFQGTAGTVTVDDTAGNVSVTGMQFAVDGYTLAGDAVTLVDDSSGNAPIIEVGDGSSASANMTATINDVLSGTDGFAKTGGGTLVLGANDWSSLVGGIAVDGGTLALATGSAVRSAITMAAGTTLANDGAVRFVRAGNGAAGAAGVVGSNFTVTNGAAGYGYISGGYGGNGDAASGYTGGAGGAGVQGTGFTLTNDAGSYVYGGLGGSGNVGGVGGAGVTGSGFTVTNSGNIYGWNGGYGVVTAGAGGDAISGSGFTVANSGLIQGQNGGGSANGAAGQGGSGIAGSGFTVTNTGAITGGRGGYSRAGAAGVGGAGIYSTGGATVINEGTISGGMSGDGATQADAIDFTGGGNTLELVAGHPGTFNGAIVVTRAAGDAADTLELGGDSGSDTFDVSQLAGGGTFGGFNAEAKSGASTWTLTGAGSASENWTITGGTLIGDATAFQGSIAFAPASGETATVEFDQGSGDTNSTADATFAGVISGAGNFTKSGDGTLTLTSANTFTGGTNINAGEVDVGNNTSLGTGTVTLAAGTTLGFAATGLDVANAVVLNGAGAIGVANGSNTLSGVIADGATAGTLEKTGSGTLTLTGANTFTGRTTISAGTLQIGDGGTSGSLGTGAIIDNGTLVFDRSDAVALPAGLTGSGALIQQGGGTFTIDGGDSGFAGTTTIKSGVATVGDDSHPSASLGGMVDVASGAMLTGVGTIGGLDLSGTLSPGGSIGTLHVTGDATVEQGSTFNVEAAPDGTADQLAVGGTTTIKGGNTIVMTQPGNWAPKTQYTIITGAGGISGTFAGVSDNQAFLTPTLGYSANDVTLTLERNDINFSTVAQNPNQAGAATGIEGLGFGNALYDAVVKLNAADAQVAFKQTSGEYHASQQTARVEDSRYVREAMNQRLRAGDNDAQAQKVGGTKLTAWAHAWGHWGTTDGDGNTAKLADNGDGLLVGADLPVGAQGRVGITGGASRNSLSIQDRDSWGRETSTWLGAFGGFDVNAFGLRGGMAYAWDRIPVNRTVNFPGFSDRLGGDATGDTLTGFIEGSWTFHFNRGSVSPFLNVAHTRVSTDASTEAGGAAALRTASSSGNVSFSTLGARSQLDLADHLNLHGELGWQHAYGDTTPTQSLQFAAGGPGFIAYGVPIAKDAGLGRIGIGWHQGNVAVDADYEGLAGNGVKDQAAKVSVSVTF